VIDTQTETDRYMDRQSKTDTQTETGKQTDRQAHGQTMLDIQDRRPINKDK